MSSDDPTEYSDSSEESETPPSEPVPEQPKATLSKYMTTFGHLVPLYRGAMDVWIFEEWSTLVATLFQGEGVPQSEWVRIAEMYLRGEALHFWTLKKANNPEANDWYYFTTSLAEQF